MLPKKNSTEYQRLRSHLNKLMQLSESEMSKRWDKWDETEDHFQAYMDLRTTSKNRSDPSGSAFEGSDYPGARPFVIPKSFSNVMTLTSHLHSTFTRRSPVISVGASTPDAFKSARFMEMHLQHQFKRTRGRLKMWFPILDSLKFNLGVVRNQWTTHKRITTTWRDEPGTKKDIFGNEQLDPGAPTRKVPVQEEQTIFEGNEIQQVDPYNFFPDPRVPLCDMEKGEFCAYRYSLPLTTLLQMAERDDDYDVNVEFIKEAFKAIRNETTEGSTLGLIGRAFRGPDNAGTRERRPIYRGQVSSDLVILEEIYVDLIPGKFGLKVYDETNDSVEKASNSIERWKFVLANFSDIIYGEPIDTPNSQYPLIGGELFPDGHRFLENVSYLDLGSPMQQAASFLINSRMDNVRLNLNGQWVVDPNAIEIPDFKRSKHGKILRLKQSARNRDVRSAIQQLPVADITAGHIASVEQMLSLADRTLFNPSTIQGQVSSGRRPATEIVAASNAAGSIIRTFAELLSAAIMEPLGEQMIMNTQQRASIQQWVDLIGLNNMQEFAAERDTGLILVSPSDFQQAAGYLYFIPHDGTSPIDPTMQANLAMQMIQVASQSPMLQVKLDLYELFKLWARGLNFQNLEAFELQDDELRNLAIKQMLLNTIPRTMGDEELMREREAGNVVPVNEAGGMQPGNNGGGMNQQAATMARMMGGLGGQ